MNLLGAPLLLSLVIAADDKPVPKFPIGKETTYVTGPLDNEGYIDYEAALNERLGKGIMPEKNANVLLWKALGPTPEGGSGMPAQYFKWLGMEEPPKKGDYFVGLHAFARDHVRLDPSEFEPFSDERGWASRRVWIATDHPNVASWLKVNQKPLAVVIEATRRPDYFNPIVCRRNQKEPISLISASLSSVQVCREIAIALSARAMLRVGEGNYDEARQDLLACHRLGRLVARGGTNIEFLIGKALDQTATEADLAYLAHAKLTARQIERHLRDLQNIPAMPLIADKIELGERFIYLDALQLVRRGSNAEEEKVLGLIHWGPALRDGNVLYDRLAAALRQKERVDREVELDKIGKEMDKLEKALAERRKKDTGLTSVVKRLLQKESTPQMIGKDIGDTMQVLMMPAARKVQSAHDVCEQTQLNLYVAFAFAAYHSENGRYPAKLDDLAPKYLAAIPEDLFSGKPPIYKTDAKGYLLYSVGVNGKDDEGRTKSDEPPGDDLVVRMPLPPLKPIK